MVKIVRTNMFLLLRNMTLPYTYESMELCIASQFNVTPDQFSGGEEYEVLKPRTLRGERDGFLPPWLVLYFTYTHKKRFLNRLKGQPEERKP